MNTDRSVLVVGSGAVASLYGGKLAQSGLETDLICRSDYKAIKSNGISVNSVWGDFHFVPRRVYSFDEQIDFYYDYILVALKVLPEINLPVLIRPAVGEKTTIILLQNGIDIEGPVASAFPGNEIISGLAFVCVNRLEPGLISHIDYGRLVLGLYPSGESLTANFLSESFNRVGVDCKLVTDVIKARWQKLVWNAPFNPLSVLCGGANTGELLEVPENIELVKNIMREVCELARASGHELSKDTIENNIKNTLAMKPYKTSMLLDYQAGRRLETEAILGNSLRIAERLKVSTPHLRCLYAMLKTADHVNGRE